MGACTVQVLYSNGRGARVKVAGQTMRNGGFTPDVWTDDNGRAVLEWSSSGDLETIYVDGRGHSGRYESGGRYVFSYPG